MSIYDGSEWKLEPESDNRTIKKLRSFSTLPTGWHYGSGGPLSKEVIGRGLQMVNHLIAVGFTSTDAFPGEYGELLVTAYNGPVYISITLEPCSTASLNYEVAKREKLFIENVDDSEIEKRIVSIARSIWSTSVSSTHRNLITPLGSSMTWHLRSLPEEECLSSNWIVQNPVAA